MELIPSENYVSSDVLQALGSVSLINIQKATLVDVITADKKTPIKSNSWQLTALRNFSKQITLMSSHILERRLMRRFYYAWCEPGDTILAMDLAHGGHLTHGAPVTRSAREYNFIRYGIKNIDTGEIDYEEIRQLA